MNIGIDISQIVYEGTGVGRFVNGLTQTILDLDKTNQWTFLFSSLRQELNPGLKKRIKQSKHRLLEFKLPPTALSFLWNTLHRMKIEKLTGNLDWFITSDWTEGPSRMKKATIIHDLVYLLYPNTVHDEIRHTQKKRMKWVKKESRIIFTDSQTTKDDAVKLLGIDNDRMVVNFPGVKINTPTVQEINATLSKFGLTRPFVLTVGKIEPRKNIKRLIQAFQDLDNPDLDLVIVGPQGWDTEVSKQQSESKHIRFLNFIKDVELACLYANCLCFVYPSLYEGFGYPVVEAMSVGAAVITSNVSSLKEIGDGASILVDPLKKEEISDAIKKIMNDPSLREKLKKQGIMKSRQFSWRRYYERMIDSLMG